MRLRGRRDRERQRERHDRRRPARLAGTLLLLALPAVAVAHPLSVSYAHLAVGNDRMTTTVRLPLDDMDLLLRIDRDLNGTVSDQEIAAAAPALLRYLVQRITVRADDTTPAPSLEQTGRWADQSGFPFVEAVLSYPVPRMPARLSLQMRILTDLYPDHRTLADIEWGARRDQFVFQDANTFDATAAPESWWHTARTFLVLGIEHILTGYDHLLFLLGLLVAGRGVGQLVAIVSSFTIAHSLTLGAATFGLVTPPARIVEAVIALSIAYVGVENLVSEAPRGRWKLTFVFGLVHGFGFANVLREMALPREALATSLFMFNLGVEIGQLAVVALVWPALRWIQRSAYAAPVTRWVSAAVTACGLFWFVQRVR
jgi:HupE / UreJ protein